MPPGLGAELFNPSFPHHHHRFSSLSSGVAFGGNAAAAWIVGFFVGSIIAACGLMAAGYFLYRHTLKQIEEEDREFEEEMRRSTVSKYDQQGGEGEVTTSATEVEAFRDGEDPDDVDGPTLGKGRMMQQRTSSVYLERDHEVPMSEDVEEVISPGAVNFEPAGNGGQGRRSRLGGNVQVARVATRWKPGPKSGWNNSTKMN